MKFDPKQNVNNLQIWLENTGDRSTYFSTSGMPEKSIKIDGWVTSRQIDMIYHWLQEHKPK